MPIEVRQLLIKSTVAAAPETGATPAPSEPTAVWRERLREEVLTECKAWLEDRLQRMRER